MEKNISVEGRYSDKAEKEFSNPVYLILFLSLVPVLML